MPANLQEFEILRNPRGQLSCQGKISYKGPVSSTHGLPRIKLDLTADERIVLPPVRTQIFHPYSDASENGFELQLLDLSHTGWKLFSVPYSSLSVSGNKPYGGNGDQIHRPNKITNIEFALWSSEKDKQVELIFDYAAFTIGAPLGK